VHFDSFVTLQHIMSYPDLPAKHQYGQSLFTKIDPITRTCNSSGVPQKHCFCLKTKAIPINTPLARELAYVIVAYMNELISSNDETHSLCVKLKFKSLISVDQEDTVDGQTWSIMLQVSPSDAAFDVRVTKDTKSHKFIIDPEVSRTNMYGNQANCIENKYPKVVFFCYCKWHLKD